MRIKERVRRGLIARAGSVTVDGIAMPPARIRLGGHNFERDEDFLEAAKRDARRLHEDPGITAQSRILDIGCGVGRLPIGLRAAFGTLPDYTGVDVNSGVIGWCERNIPDGRFVWLDLSNERYNPRGAKIDKGFRLPLADGSFDAIYLYSVFSHMTTEQVQAYLREFNRLLAVGGSVFLTAFVEPDVEDEAINPSDYGTFPGEWDGALHCVRFDRDFFSGLVTEAGLKIGRFDHASDTDGQSAIYLRRSA